MASDFIEGLLGGLSQGLANYADYSTEQDRRKEAKRRWDAEQLQQALRAKQAQANYDRTYKQTETRNNQIQSNYENETYYKMLQDLSEAQNKNKQQNKEFNYNKKQDALNRQDAQTKNTGQTQVKMSAGLETQLKNYNKAKDLDYKNYLEKIKGMSVDTNLSNIPEYTFPSFSQWLKNNSPLKNSKYVPIYLKEFFGDLMGDEIQGPLLPNTTTNTQPVTTQSTNSWKNWITK